VNKFTRKMIYLNLKNILRNFGEVKRDGQISKDKSFFKNQIRVFKKSENPSV
jgi:hypothetical protein